MYKFKLLLLFLMNIYSLHINAETRDERVENNVENDLNYDKFIFVTLGSNATEKPGSTNNLVQYHRVDTNISSVTEKGHVLKNKGNLRIINGAPAALGDVPWQVALKTGRSRYKYSAFCGGSIIARNKVLSAAHCVEKWMTKSPLCSKGVIDGKKLRRVHVVAGTLRTASQLFDDGQWRRIKVAYHPPRYRFPHNDIAVLVLTKNFTYDSHVHSVLMQTNYENMVGKCLASGFGGINSAFSKNVIQSQVLLTAYLTMLANRDCAILHTRKNTHKFICTAVQPTDTSSGDSGGPLVCFDPNKPKREARLVGVVCGALTKRIRGKQYQVSYFTRVSAYQKFINRSKAYMKHPTFILIIAHTFNSFLIK